MANIRSQIKRNRQNERRRVRNLAVRSRLKTEARKAVRAAESGERDAALELRELSGRVNGMIGRANNLMQQLTNLGTTLRQNAPTERAAIDETRGALEELRTFRDTDLARPLPGLGYRQYPRLREEVQSLYGSVNRSLNRPTDAQLLRKQELDAETAAAEAKLNAIVNGRIAKVNALLKNLPHIVVAGGGIS